MSVVISDITDLQIKKLRAIGATPDDILSNLEILKGHEFFDEKVCCVLYDKLCRVLFFYFSHTSINVTKTIFLCTRTHIWKMKHCLLSLIYMYTALPHLLLHKMYFNQNRNHIRKKNHQKFNGHLELGLIMKYNTKILMYTTALPHPFLTFISPLISFIF